MREWVGGRNQSTEEGASSVRFGMRRGLAERAGEGPGLEGLGEGPGGMCAVTATAAEVALVGTVAPCPALERYPAVFFEAVGTTPSLPAAACRLM